MLVNVSAAVFIIATALAAIALVLSAHFWYRIHETSRKPRTNGRDHEASASFSARLGLIWSLFALLLVVTAFLWASIDYFPIGGASGLDKGAFALFMAALSMALLDIIQSLVFTFLKAVNDKPLMEPFVRPKTVKDRRKLAYLVLSLGIGILICSVALVYTGFNLYWLMGAFFLGAAIAIFFPGTITQIMHRTEGTFTAWVKSNFHFDSGRIAFFNVRRSTAIYGLQSVYGWSALAGMLGPLVLLIADFAVAVSNPNYNFIRDSISSLALTPMGWIQTIGFLVIGLMMEGFLFGLVLSIRGARGFKLGVGLLAFFGFGLLIIGAFHTGLLAAPNTVDSSIHYATTSTIFGLFPIGCLLIAPSIKKDPNWRSLFAYTLFASAFSLVFMSAWLWFQPAIENWLGLFERIIVIQEAVWVEVAAIRLMRLAMSEEWKTEKSQWYFGLKG